MAKVLVVLGSTREGRMGERVAKMVISQLESVGAVPSLLDPLEMDVPTLTQPYHFMKDKSQAPEWMTNTLQKIQNAQGLVMVSAEYNCAIPPALCNVLDYFPPASFRHKPTSIATYSMGPFGGVRVVMPLRSFLAELGAISLPSTLSIPTIQNAGIAADGVVTDNERVTNNCQKMCKELVWYIEAMSAQAEKSGGNPN